MFAVLKVQKRKGKFTPPTQTRWPAGHVTGGSDSGLNGQAPSLLVCYSPQIYDMW